MTEQFARKMEEGVKPLGIQLSEKQLEQFYDYFQFLVEKNKVMNLTAITEEDAVITKHFCDSLSLVKGFSEIERGLTVRWGACSQLSGALEWRTRHLDFSEKNGFRHLLVYPARIIDESSLPASPVKNIIHKHTNNTN